MVHVPCMYTVGRRIYRVVYRVVGREVYLGGWVYLLLRVLRGVLGSFPLLFSLFYPIFGRKEAYIPSITHPGRHI